MFWVYLIDNYALHLDAIWIMTQVLFSRIQQKVHGLNHVYLDSRLSKVLRVLNHVDILQVIQ